MKKIINFLFRNTVKEIQDDAIFEYQDLTDKEFLSMARMGVSFYIRGNNKKNGKHELYKFTPQSLGEHETIIISPNNKSQKIFWKDGKKI